MLGHDFRYTETNYASWYALCSCGWSGPRSAWETKRNPRTKRDIRNRELTVDALHAQWEQHCDDERAGVAAASERVLAANATAVEKLIPITSRPGRFGHR